MKENILNAIYEIIENINKVVVPIKQKKAPRTCRAYILSKAGKDLSILRHDYINGKISDSEIIRFMLYEYTKHFNVIDEDDENIKIIRNLENQI